MSASLFGKEGVKIFRVGPREAVPRGPEARVVQAEQEALSRVETGSSKPGGGVQGTEGASGHLRRFRQGEGRE